MLYIYTHIYICYMYIYMYVFYIYKISKFYLGMRVKLCSCYPSYYSGRKVTNSQT